MYGTAVQPWAVANQGQGSSLCPPMPRVESVCPSSSRLGSRFQFLSITLRILILDFSGFPKKLENVSFGGDKLYCCAALGGCQPRPRVESVCSSSSRLGSSFSFFRLHSAYWAFRVFQKNSRSCVRLRCVPSCVVFSELEKNSRM